MVEKQIIVACGLIRKGKKILLAKRHSKSKFQGGKWEMSGGKIAIFENPKDTLMRELEEELGIKVKVGELFDVVDVILENEEEKRHVILIAYLCDWLSGEPRTIECEEVVWLEKKDLKGLDFTVGTKPFIKKYLQPN